MKLGASFYVPPSICTVNVLHTLRRLRNLGPVHTGDKIDCTVDRIDRRVDKIDHAVDFVASVYG